MKRYGTAVSFGVAVMVLIAVLTNLPTTAPLWLKDWVPGILAGLAVLKAVLMPSTVEGVNTEKKSQSRQ